MCNLRFKIENSPKMNGEDLFYKGIFFLSIKLFGDQFFPRFSGFGEYFLEKTSIFEE